MSNNLRAHDYLYTTDSQRGDCSLQWHGSASAVWLVSERKAKRVADAGTRLQGQASRAASTVEKTLHVGIRIRLSRGMVLDFSRARVSVLQDEAELGARRPPMKTLKITIGAWGGSLRRMVRHIRVLGILRGLKYWRIELACIHEPQKVVEWAEHCVDEGFRCYMRGDTRGALCMWGWANELGASHLSYVSDNSIPSK